MPTRVILYTRQGCHLCVDARDVVAQICAETETMWREVDVDHDSDVAAAYGDEIPVVTVNAEVVGFWRINPDLLRLALQ